MSNYSTLKAAISAVIKENNNHEITGQVLQTTLLAMVDSLAGGYLFKGIATPATVVGTPDENVFYIGGGGVYNNFGATPVHVPDGCIGIFTYNGSFVNHIIPTGGVFDISAYNAVGGTPATYADLTAALGTNGANIPDYLRKGGMSVKFIQGSAQSSDNKYVQYRLMAQSFTTDVTQWQGVDDKPTTGSDNLVKSGGVDLLAKKQYARGFVVDSNHFFDISSNPKRYKYHTSWDTILVASPLGAKKCIIENAIPTRFRQFNAPILDEEHYVGTSDDGTTVDGCKYLAIALFKANNPNGYDDVLIRWELDDSVIKNDIKELAKKQYSRGFYIDYNHLWNISSTDGSYVDNSDFDSILVTLDTTYEKIVLENAVVTRYNFFNTPSIQYSNYIKSNVDGNIPTGAKYCVISMRHSDNTDGYDNVLIFYDLNLDKYETKINAQNTSKNQSSRGFYVDYNHLFSLNGESSSYISNDNFDSILFPVNREAISVSLNNCTVRRYVFFNKPELVYANYIDSNTDGAIPTGAMYCCATMRKSDNSAGYDNVLLQWGFEEESVPSKLMKVKKTTSYLYIRTKLSAVNDIMLIMYEKQGNMTFYAMYVGNHELSDDDIVVQENKIGSISDIVGAIGVSSFWYLYAQHGWTIPLFTASGHSLDSTDIGSVWKDQNNKQFTIGNIDGNNIYLLPVISKDDTTQVYSASWQGNESYPTTITHVSGGIHTSSISGTSTRYDINIQTSQNRKFIADGQEITENGEYYCDDLIVRENILGYNIGKIETWFPNPIYNGSMIDWDRTFIFKGSNVACNTVINTVYPFEITDYRGCIPIMPTLTGDYHSYTFIPKVKALTNGHRVDLPFNSDDGTIEPNRVIVTRNTESLYDVNDQPDRCIAYLKDNEDNYLLGMAGGCSLLRGISKKEERNTNIQVGETTCTYGGTGTPNKFYPILLDSSSFQNGIVPNTFIKEFCCYYCWFDPSANEGQVYWYKDGDSYVVYIHCQTTQSKMEVNLPDYMEGLYVNETIEKTDGTTLLTTQVISGKLYVSFVTTENSANYIVVKLG